MCVKNNDYHTNPDVMKGCDIKELISIVLQIIIEIFDKRRWNF